MRTTLSIVFSLLCGLSLACGKDDKDNKPPARPSPAQKVIYTCSNHGHSVTRDEIPKYTKEFMCEGWKAEKEMPDDKPSPKDNKPAQPGITATGTKWVRK